MSGQITSVQLNQQMLSISRELDDAQAELVASAHKYAEAERDYRKKRSLAWLDPTVKDVRLADEKADKVKELSADARFERDLAMDLRRIAYIRVGVLEAKLSALQSIANSVRSEAMLAGRYEGRNEGRHEGAA